jgi:hypothetical protein
MEKTYYERRSEAQKQIGSYLITYIRLGFPWRKDSIQVTQFGYNSDNAIERLKRKEHPFDIKIEDIVQLKRLPL